MNDQQILVAAVGLARTYGYNGVLKRHIAAHLHCATGTINYHWESMAALRAAMVKHAKKNGLHEAIIRAGLPR